MVIQVTLLPPSGIFAIFGSMKVSIMYENKIKV